MAKQWYVIHTQTGYEDRVRSALEAKIKSAAAGEKISQVLVPIEQVSEIKAGKKKISQRKFFPGYILV
jgi:transcriptional antiterminator NusG